MFLYENDLHIPEDPKSYFTNDLINIRLEKINNNFKTIEHLDQPLTVQDAAHLLRSTGFVQGAYENKLEGTEHGTVVRHFLIGSKINGGFYGEQPSLSQLKMEIWNLSLTIVTFIIKFLSLGFQFLIVNFQVLKFLAFKK